MHVHPCAAACPCNLRLQALLNELEMMARLRHPNIVTFVEYFLQDDPAKPHHGACIIVMELLEGPDMMDFIDEHGGFTVAEAKACICLNLYGPTALSAVVHSG